MYENSIVPEHWPGGGGFAVVKYSLETLYDMFLKCRNWWTSSNQDLPLCRYLGCSIRFYQCDNVDYVIKIQRELPARSNKLTYPSCQPNVMLMSKQKLIVPSRKNEKRRKPYKKVFIKPPPQLKTDWYFQVDMYKTPLFVLYASACDLSNFFIKPNQLSNNVTFTVLNTLLIQNRAMKTSSTQSWFYKQIGTVSYYFWRYDGNLPLNIPHNFKLGDLCPLTQLKTSHPGHSYNDRSNWETEHPTNFNAYLQQFKTFWGNPFNSYNIEEQDRIFITLVSPESFQNQATSKSLNENHTWQDLQFNREYTLTKLDDKLFIQLQYNPEKDTGDETLFYLLPNTAGHGWDPPLDEDLILGGFPIWISCYGYLDFQKKLQKAKNIDTEQILVIKSKHTQKPFNLPIVIINIEFTRGHSPYESKILPEDNLKWYPQVQYQMQELNMIAKCGPATPQIDTLSENIKMYYTFYWKWGGSPPKTVNIENPSLQEQYPIPRNEYETHSLQNPAQAAETILYNFDQRHGSLTRTALQRITEDWETKSFVPSITDPTTRRDLATIFQQLQESEKKEQETQTEIQQQLQQLKFEQHSLRQQIISLITQT